VPVPKCIVYFFVSWALEWNWWLRHKRKCYDTIEVENGLNIGGYIQVRQLTHPGDNYLEIQPELRRFGRRPLKTKEGLRSRRRSCACIFHVVVFLSNRSFLYICCMWTNLNLLYNSYKSLFQKPLRNLTSHAVRTICIWNIIGPDTPFFSFWKLIKQPMRANFERYVDQITQNVIAPLNI
jgi:hypothetical protein